MIKIYCLVFILLLTTNTYPQWVQTNGPCGGEVSRIAVSGTTIFAAVGDNGVFCSTDIGNNWTASNSGLSEPRVQSLVFSGTNVFAATLGGIFATTNNDAQWVRAGLTDTVVLSLLVSGANLYAGTLHGVFLSTNNGISWIQGKSGLTDTIVLSVTVSNTNIYAGTHNGGVFLSTDNGTNWVPKSEGLAKDQEGHYFAINSLAVSGRNLYAGIQNGGIFLSTDGGTNWTRELD